MISLQYRGKIYNIETEPFELIEDSYKRGWFIVKSFVANQHNISAIYSSSIIMINKNKGMIY